MARCAVVRRLHPQTAIWHLPSLLADYILRLAWRASSAQGREKGGGGHAWSGRPRRGRIDNMDRVRRGEREHPLEQGNPGRACSRPVVTSSAGHVRPPASMNILNAGAVRSSAVQRGVAWRGLARQDAER